MVAAAFAVAACGKPEKVEFPDLTPEETLAGYAGDYDLTEMQWEADPFRTFDLDEDGKTGDVFTELMNLTNIKNRWPDFMRNIAVYRTRIYEDGSIDMKFDGVVPIQAYSFNGNAVVKG